MKSLYVANPLGFSEAGRMFLYSVLIPVILSEKFRVIDPWILTPREAVERVARMPYGIRRRQAWEELNKIIGANNEKGIRKSDGIVAVLDGTDVDSGTASEIGFGAGIGKRTLGYRTDFRLAGDNDGSIVNLQVEHFIYRNGGKIVKNIPELRRALKELFV